MSTEAQHRANKQNAKHSTGPRTEEGKQRSSQNALKHGFRAKDPLIPGEDPDEYHRHCGGFALDLQPRGALEEDLVGQIADMSWRLKRFARIESAVINDFYEDAAKDRRNDGCDGDELLGKCVTNYYHLPALDRLGRYQTQLARRYHNAMRELRELRKESRRSHFDSLAAGLRAEPQAASSGEAEKTEQTQSVATLLESIAPMRSPPPEPGLSGPSFNGFHQIDPESPSRPGNWEAQK